MREESLFSEVGPEVEIHPFRSGRVFVGVILRIACVLVAGCWSLSARVAESKDTGCTEPLYKGISYYWASGTEWDERFGYGFTPLVFGSLPRVLEGLGLEFIPDEELGWGAVPEGAESIYQSGDGRWVNLFRIGFLRRIDREGGCSCRCDGAELGSVDIVIPVGDSDKIVANLKLKDEFPNSSTFTPGAIEVEKVWDVDIYPQPGGSAPRYVVGGQFAAEITSYGTSGMEIKVGKYSNIVTTDGQVTISFSSVISRTWILNDGSLTKPTSLIWREERDGETKESRYEWSSNFMDWRFVEEHGDVVTRMRRERKTATRWSETRIRENRAGTELSRETRVYETLAAGERVVEIESGEGEKTFIEYSTGGQRITAITKGDGQWHRFEYSGSGALKKEIRPLGNAPPGSPESECEVTTYYRQSGEVTPLLPTELLWIKRFVKGREVERNFRFETFDPVEHFRVSVVEQSAPGRLFGDPRNVRTTVEYFDSDAPAASRDKPRRVIASSGLTSEHSYVGGNFTKSFNGKGTFVPNPTGKYIQITTLLKSGNDGDLQAKTVSVKDGDDRELQVEKFQRVPGGGWVPLPWRVTEYDSGGRVTKVRDNLGVEASYTYSQCCGKITSANHRNGVSEEFFYDSEKRLSESRRRIGQRQPSIKRYHYRADGRLEREETVFGDDVDAVTFDYDRSGRIIARGDSVSGEGLSYVYGVNDRTISVISNGASLIRVVFRSAEEEGWEVRCRG